ncbi:MAG: histidinol-phosphatase HisJ family protein [Bacilli bacterium]|nr:histidinol-phosphatase HisJ family protein [Bacilli bacterium]
MSKYIDSHVHSKISHDGKSHFIEHMVEARIKHIEELTFTEHFDDYTGTDSMLSTLDVDNYKKEYLRFKDDSLVKTNFGIEIGLRPESYDLITTMCKKHSFDFIIGSSHITCGKDMAYDKSFFEGITPKEAIIKYFNEVLTNILTYNDEFDVYGHLDYVIRYVIKNYGNSMDRISYNEFKECLDTILNALIKKDKGIEINTSGIRYGLGTPHPNIEIIKRYKELGGKIITMGSDAHSFKDLASNFDDAYDILEESGFDEFAVYHNRRPKFIKIKEMRK